MVESLRKQAQKISTKEEIASVATNSAADAEKKCELPCSGGM